MNPTATKSKASQNFVPIKEIRDDILSLKDDSLRIILMASAMNFALKSAEEQTALTLQYQNFLNSLDFSIQIFIESRSLNIEPYLDDLRKKEKDQTNELLKTQMHEYIGFVKEFVSATNIVNKSFYIVIPYFPTAMSEIKNNPIASFFNQFRGNKNKTTKQLQTQKFDEYKLQLQQRADTVIQGLSRIGIRTVPLNTQELIELFFKLYNPDESEAIKIPEYGPVS